MEGLKLRKCWRRSCVAVLVSASIAVFAYLSVPEAFPRLDDLPPFEKTKAGALSNVRRKELERELFSELRRWDTSSRRFPGTKAGLEAREASWRGMAAEGLELADIVLRVLDPSSRRVYSLTSAMRRLEHLAAQGDSGAMCLMVGLVNVASVRHDFRNFQEKYNQWLLEGARVGHPECWDQLGGRMLFGTDGHGKQESMGLQYLFRASARGYVHGAGSLAIFFRERGMAHVDDARRCYCWSYVADKERLSESEMVWGSATLVLQQLRKEHPPGAKTEWDGLLKELADQDYSAADCIALGKGDIK